MDPGNRRAVIAALCANLGIAIAKSVGYAMTGAASMLAEAVHSLADSTNQALLLSKERTDRYEPQCHHRLLQLVHEGIHLRVNLESLVSTRRRITGETLRQPATADGDLPGEIE